MTVDHAGRTALYSTQPRYNATETCVDGCLVSLRVHGNVNRGAVFRFPERKGGGVVVLTLADRKHLIDLLNSFDNDEVFS